MLGPDTLVCGCVGKFHDGKWWCPLGHDFVESYFAGEMTSLQMRKAMQKASIERAEW